MTPELALAALHILLLIVMWLYCGLNFAFFRFPWPWTDWTACIPNALVFSVCAVGLTLGALTIRRARTEVRNHPDGKSSIRDCEDAFLGGMLRDTSQAHR